MTFQPCDTGHRFGSCRTKVLSLNPGGRRTKRDGGDWPPKWSDVGPLSGSAKVF